MAALYDLSAKKNILPIISGNIPLEHATAEFPHRVSEFPFQAFHIRQRLPKPFDLLTVSIIQHYRIVLP